jgi:hypothetical protein
MNEQNQGVNTQAPAPTCPRCGRPLGYPPFGGSYGCTSMACRLMQAMKRAQEAAQEPEAQGEE